MHSNPSNVQASHCHFTPSQQNVFYIRSKLSTQDNPLYLDVTQGDQLHGQRVIVNRFNNSDTQQWIVSNTGFIRPIANKKLVMDVKNQTGPEVILYHQNSGNNQLWSVKGDVIFSDIAGGKCLDVENEKKIPGTRVIVYQYLNQRNQQWE